MTFKIWTVGPYPESYQNLHQLLLYYLWQSHNSSLNMAWFLESSQCALRLLSISIVSTSTAILTPKEALFRDFLTWEHILESFKLSESVSTFILSWKLSLLDLICSQISENALRAQKPFDSATQICFYMSYIFTHFQVRAPRGPLASCFNPLVLPPNVGMLQV